MENLEDTIGVQEEEDTPAPEQESEEPGQAGDGVVTLGSATQYSSKRRPDVKVSGADLLSGYQRGLRFDGLQSEHQKLQAETAGKDDQIATLQAQVTASATKEQAAQILQDIRDAGGAKPTEDWEEPPAATNGVPVSASRIEEIVARTTKGFLDQELPGIKEAAMGVASQQREEEALRAQRQQTADTFKANTIASLRVKYPDVGDAELDEVVRLQTEYTGHLASAVDNYNAGQTDEGATALFDGQEVMSTLAQKQAAIAAQQQKITAQKEADAELEGLGQGTLPGEEPEEDTEPSYKKSDVEAKREGRLAKAKRIMTRQAAIKNSGM